MNKNNRFVNNNPNIKLHLSSSSNYIRIKFWNYKNKEIIKIITKLKKNNINNYKIKLIFYKRIICLYYPKISNYLQIIKFL